MSINARLDRLEKALAYRLDLIGRPPVKVYEVDCDGNKRLLWTESPHPRFSEIRIHAPCSTDEFDEIVTHLSCEEK